MKARVEKSWISDSVTLYFFENLNNGRIGLLQREPELKEIDPISDMSYQEGIRISQTTAQQLMDSLWDCGLRPSEGSGSAGALLATQNHLSDMQKLSWKLIDMVGNPNK